MAQQERAQRLRVVIRGAVQGVGFRPFIYRLATDLGLTGWVNNSAQGVFIDVEGPKASLDTFLLRLEPEKPPHAFIQSLEASFLDPAGYAAFEIRHSDESGAKTALVLPDMAICADCLAELFDPANRRYRYPFTNCTNCGPRFSIIEALPYDRPHTTMKGFILCDRCLLEYTNPLDRRFHAQPNACPDCGPHLELWDAAGRILACHDAALLEAAEAIRRGEVVAVKGIGGFHLMADARNETVVHRLRERKRREEKPFALMVPSLEVAERLCTVDALEARLLRSVESPIVLLRRGAAGDSVAPSVAPGNPLLGLMLPCTPLHHLLMAELNCPVVATSGNLSNEPICTDEREALQRLRGIADRFLVHNRPIARPIDDSVVRVQLGRELILRRARGYAPLPIPLKANLPPVLAVGAHLKNAVALSVGKQVFVSQHVGDLETAPACESFRRTIDDLSRLYEHRPALVACDLHPDYLSTQYARQSGLPTLSVQHHYAHVLACMAENELEGPALGVSWDGTGYGPDGTVWGGEFLCVTNDGYARAAHLRAFPLPGGEKAVKEPRRSALGLLYALYGEALFDNSPAPELLAAFTPQERKPLRAMLQKEINAPLTSSAGRLFDAVAALVGLRQITQFEGQAAMELEFAMEGVEPSVGFYPPSLTPSRTASTNDTHDAHKIGNSCQLVQCMDSTRTPSVVDWADLVEGILHDRRANVPTGVISARFHNTLVEMIVAVAKQVGEEWVVLTGGCFQNRYLTERAVTRLCEEGFRPCWHQRIPPNDGGIALGQAVAAARTKEQPESCV